MIQLNKMNANQGLMVNIRTIETTIAAKVVFTLQDTILRMASNARGISLILLARFPAN